MKKKIILICSLFSFLILIACQDSNDLNESSVEINDRWLPQNVNVFDIEVTELAAGGGFVIRPYGGSEYGELEPIFLESPQDPLIAIVKNGYDDGWSQDINYILKLFYNYEEIAFRIGSSSEYMTEFPFTIEAGYRFEIPLHLNLTHEPDETVSKLTAGLFVNPEIAFGTIGDILESPENEALWWSFFSNNVLNFEINYGSDKEHVLSIPEFDEATIISYDLPFASVSINQFFELPYMAFDEESFINDNFIEPEGLGQQLSIRYIQATPGESIDLAFSANVHSGITEPMTDFLIIAMLDWQQVDLHEQPYLWISTNPAEDQRLTHGRFSIDAPTEPGFYEFVLFAVPNPTAPLSWGNYAPLEVARMTIEVTEE